MKMQRERSLPAFVRGNVLVIGDTILDIYHEGSPAGISVETPTLVVHHERTSVTLGGAAFLVRNMLALGGSVTFVTLAGTDEHARYLKKFSHARLKKKLFVDSRPTTVKERFWSNQHKLLAWDRVDNSPIPSALEDEIIAYLKKNIASFERIVVSDYRHGLLTERLAAEIVRIAARAKKDVFVDSQVAQQKTNHAQYAGAGLFSLNTKEAKNIYPKFDESKLEASLSKLRTLLKARHIVLKLGEKGSFSLIGTSSVETPAYEVRERDTIGAGDAFFAVLACSQHIDEIALRAANAWAGLKRTHLGTETPSLKELKKILRASHV